MERYNHKEIEKKWRAKWDKDKVAEIDKDEKTKDKYYVLDMFPYPSGEGIHMGHTENYTASDVFYRFKKMKGFNVLHPQGFDAFGLPAENYAIKTGIHPAKTTEDNINTYIGQMKSLGLNYDFNEEVITSNPEYYKWTQWIFGAFYKNDLVYKKTTKTNWCSSCQTVIANEQVVSGECERCSTEIAQKETPSWFFRITDFADDLINDLDKVDWPEHTKKNQKNWIGKSEGAMISFKLIADSSQLAEKKLEVFTTRPDTLFGATYMVLAPDHPLVMKMKDNILNWSEVEKYIIQTQKKTEMERVENKEKSGVKLEGVFAINPANDEEIPIFIADYVLSGYGTGAIMAVPAHDERDWDFATKFDLPIIEVISGGDMKKEAYTGDGSLINSGDLNGLPIEEAKKKITEIVGGEMTTTYRLRDWSISRQRYWGCPIPIIYSPEGEPTLIPEEHLPWTLPTDVDFKPTGISPLSDSKELKERTEKIFGEGWTPEYDTMDTFVDSSWYFLRYPDTKNTERFASKERLEHWMPVDLYIGGAEHTYMHLLFARFFVKALKKIGLVDFDEPFLKLRHQGMVMAPDGKKMSKSLGNVVNPNEMIEMFGADSVRAYVLFLGPLEDMVIWNEDNIVGVYRFLEKVWDQSNHLAETTSDEVKNILHKTIKKVGNDIEELKYNTAISEMMKLMNVTRQGDLNKEDYSKILKILAPFAPFITEELWNKMGNSWSIHDEIWPEYDENLLQDATHVIAVQVMGKVRAEIEIKDGANEEEVKNIAISNEVIKKWIGNSDIKKIIYVKNKILNIVI